MWTVITHPETGATAVVDEAAVSSHLGLGWEHAADAATDADPQVLRDLIGETDAIDGNAKVAWIPQLPDPTFEAGIPSTPAPAATPAAVKPAAVDARPAKSSKE